MVSTAALTGALVFALASPTEASAFSGGSWSSSSGSTTAADEEPSHRKNDPDIVSFQGVAGLCACPAAPSVMNRFSVDAWVLPCLGLGLEGEAGVGTVVWWSSEYTSFDLTATLAMNRWRVAPFLKVGVGAMRWEAEGNLWPYAAETTSGGGPNLLLGTGVRVRFRSRLRLQLEARGRSEIGSDGAEVVAVSLAFGPGFSF